jgi:hypothetical protein
MVDSQYKFETVTMDIASSMAFDKEEWLELLVEKSGFSPEEFGVYYVIEEYPMQFDITTDYSRIDTVFKATQEFRVRLKTPEEIQLELETTKGVKDDSNESD